MYKYSYPVERDRNTCTVINFEVARLPELVLGPISENFYSVNYQSGHCFRVWKQ